MANFGIFKGFSDKLFEGELPTNLGTIGISGIDADAQAFFDRVTTAGGSLSATEKTAVNKLVLDLKGYSIWSKMKAIYPMVGASSAACAQNLKSSSFTGTFSGGWTFASTGATPNGTTGYMDTGLIPSNDLQLNSTHISGYLRTNNSVAGPILSAENATNFNNGLYIWPGGTGNSPSVRINDNTSTTYAAGTDIRGLHIATRTASNEKKMRRNKTEMFSVTVSSTGLNVDSIYVAKSRNNNNYYTNSIALITIGDGLSNAECDLFYDAQQAFQTTLSRQV